MSETLHQSPAPQARRGLPPLLKGLLLALLAGTVAALAVIYVPRFGKHRPPGFYLMEGGSDFMHIGPGGSSFEIQETSYQLRGATVQAYGGSKSLRIETDMSSMAGWSSGSSTHKDIGIMELTPSKASPGSYDLRLIYNESRRTNPWLDFLDRFLGKGPPPPGAPSAPPVPNYLYRVEDPAAQEYLRLAAKEPSLGPVPGQDPVPTSSSIPLAPPSPHAAELLHLATAAMAANPEDLHLRVLVIDALIRGRKQAELREHLEKWRPDFEAAAAGDPLLYASFQEAERQEQSMRLSAAGTNGYEKMARFLAPNTELPARLKLLSRLLVAEGLIPPKPLAVREESVNFLEAQVSAKTAMVEVRFLLASGKFQEARRLAASLYRFGQLIEAYNDHLITKLIGSALRGIGASALETAVLDGTLSTSDTEEMGKMLEALSAHERLTESVDFRDRSKVRLPVTAGLLPNYSEAKTRYTVSNIRFQLIRTANAVRHHLLSEGMFPDPADPAALASLLPAGLPIDPYSPTSGPLTLRHDVTSDTLVIYSYGPDGRDDGGALAYNSANGTTSPGDILIRVPRQRQHPFPAEGVHAATMADVEREFPKGLPLDPFADTRGRGLSLAQTTGPVYLYSFGPDTDEAKVLKQGSSYIPTLPYDPTNGTVSAGDLFLELPTPRPSSSGTPPDPSSPARLQ